MGISEISNFAKYEVWGPDAEGWLSHIMANRMPAEGRIVLTPMLNEKGKLIGDFSVAKLSDSDGEPRFYILGSGSAEVYHMRWFRDHLPADGSVSIRPLGLGLTGLSIAGPKSRDLLAALTDADVSTAAFPFMSIREMALGAIPAMVGRITFTGDLGYEIWVAPEYQRLLLTRLMEAGADMGIRPFGMRALMSMRLEKNFGTWAGEYRPIYGPFEAGLDRFVDLRKNDFIGRDAAAKEKDEGPERRLVSFVVDAGDADVIADEPIWLGEEVIGWVTSGGYAHHAGVSMAQGYVPSARVSALSESDANLTIEILGERRAARLQADPIFDPDAKRMRG